MRPRASMRPQHITAENLKDGLMRWLSLPACFNEAAAYHCGKRPEPRSFPVFTGSFNEAAAYHCGKPGFLGGFSMPRVASMRPQHITAENGLDRVLTGAVVAGFNEAAAYHCGKHEGKVYAEHKVIVLQ